MTKERYNFRNLENLFNNPDNEIPCLRAPRTASYTGYTQMSNIDLSADTVCGFLDPRCSYNNKDFGFWDIFINGNSLKSKYKKYYKTRRDCGGYYKLWSQFEFGVKYLSAQTSYSEINGTEILSVRILNDEYPYKFVITYTEGEDFISVATKIIPEEFYLPRSFQQDYMEDAAAQVMMMAHILSSIILICRPDESDMSIFKDNILFNLNIFEKRCDNMIKMLPNWNKVRDPNHRTYPDILEVYSYIVGQENGFQLSYYNQGTTFMYIVTYTDKKKNDKPTVTPNDVFVNTSCVLNQYPQSLETLRLISDMTQGNINLRNMIEQQTNVSSNVAIQTKILESQINSNFSNGFIK